MEIQGPGRLFGARRVDPREPAGRSEAASGAAKGADEVQISTHARLLDALRKVPPVREDVVQRLREEIASGAYETQDKLEVAVDRLLEELA